MAGRFFLYWAISLRCRRNRVVMRGHPAKIALCLVKTMKLQRLIVTGANGTGKSHFARELAAARPDIPLISYDAIKLTSEWKRRPQSEIAAALSDVIQGRSWILEGGPSLLPQAIKYADGVMWLDPPEWLRAWRLFVRPLRNLGKTRPELPDGNVDWPWQQYGFAIRSLRNRIRFQSDITAQLAAASALRVWRIRSATEGASAIAEWRRTVA